MGVLQRPSEVISSHDSHASFYVVMVFIGMIFVFYLNSLWKCNTWAQALTHLLQTDSGPLDQRLQASYGLVFSQQKRVERRARQVAVAFVGDHVSRAKAPGLGVHLAALWVCLWRQSKRQQNL